MDNFTTTLNKIRSQSPCKEGWKNGDVDAEREAQRRDLLTVFSGEKPWL